MTIRQQGGIFGRNPTFSDVDAKSVTLTDSSPLLKMIDADDTDQVAEINCGFGHIDIKADINNDRGSSRITFQIDGSEVGRWDSNGNLVIANSGQGIDFSATSGTGTSELFDDYEEGTWTPAVAAGAISGTSVSYAGSYTKVGNKVTVTFKAANAAGDIQVSSYAVLSGLPFAASADQGGTSTITTEDIDVFARQGFASVASGTSSLSLSAAGSASGTVKLQVSLTYLT